MSFTDRLSLGQRRRDTNALNPSSSAEPATRRQTSPFGRGTGSLGMGGETVFDQIGREMGLDSHILTRILGITDVMLEGWQRGMMQPSGSSLEQWERVKRMHKRLYARYSVPQALEWLRTPNERIHYQAPVDALIRGDLHKVEDALDHLEASPR